MKKKSRFLQTPVEPFAVEAGLTADEVLARMERISFQGRNLATAHRIWQKMLQDDVTIFMGMAGALSRRRPPADRRAPDHQSLRRLSGLDRREPVSRPARNARPASLRRIAARRRRRAGGGSHRSRLRHLRQRRRVHRERQLDRGLRRDARTATLHDAASSSICSAATCGKPPERDGILTAAYRANVPIFCPAIADSSIGMGLSQARQKKPGAGHIDIIGDIVESANMIIRRPRTASVVLGGGTPKNFINQASVQAEFYSDRGRRAIATRCRS